jgi:hypothetical protein
VGREVMFKSSLDGVKLGGYRGMGDLVEVTIAPDARRSGSGFFEVLCEGVGKAVRGVGKVSVARPDPLFMDMRTVLGGKSSAVIPMEEELWQGESYEAFFEPSVRGFAVSPNPGQIVAGAKVLPFKVFCAPISPKPVGTSLIVQIGHYEMVVRLRGSVGGFRKKAD